MPECTTPRPSASSRHRHRQHPAKRRRQVSRTRLPGGVRTGNVPMDEGSPQTMLVAAATGFSAGKEAGYRLSLHVYDLGPPVDPETAVRIVPNGIKCRRVERRFLDLPHRRIGPARKLGIATLVHVRVPPGDGLLQVRQRNSLELMAAMNFRGKLLDRVCAKEEAIGRRCEWRIDVPFITLDGSTIEDCPDRSGEEIRRFRTLVHGQCRMDAVGL